MFAEEKSQKSLDKNSVTPINHGNNIKLARYDKNTRLTVVKRS